MRMDWIRGASHGYRSEVYDFNAYKDAMNEGSVSTLAGSLPATSTRGVVPATIPAGVLHRLQKLVYYLKKMPAYSESMGQGLGIVAPSCGAFEADSFLIK